MTPGRLRIGMAFNTDVDDLKHAEHEINNGLDLWVYGPKVRGKEFLDLSGQDWEILANIGVGVTCNLRCDRAGHVPSPTIR